MTAGRGARSSATSSGAMSSGPASGRGATAKRTGTAKRGVATVRPEPKRGVTARGGSAGRAAPAPNLVRVSVERGASAPGLGPAVLKRRAERMLAALDLQGVEVSVALVADETIRTLNREWRKKDKPTDVLSFPMMDDAAPPSRSLGTAGADGGAPTLLGDVIVSTPTAIRQARARGAALADEVTVLLAHGVLHLLGFDHGSDDDEREMNAYARVLEAAAVSRLPMRLKLVPVRPR